MILLLFGDLVIQGYTVVSDVGGSGKGGVSGKGGWTDRIKLYLIALDDEHTGPLLNALRELHVRLVQERHGLEAPLKVFVQPCELIV